MSDTDIKDRQFYLLHARTKQFCKRVDLAIDHIVDAWKIGSVAVSVSWGKDSTALAAISLHVFERVFAFHLQSPHSLPGWETVRAFFESSGRFDLSIIQKATSLQEYIEWVNQVGLPHERTRNEQKNAVAYLKKDPAREWAIENGYQVVLLGMRAEENPGTRGKLFKTRGPMYQLKSGLWICNPLASWSADDVWAYIYKNNITYHPLYDKETHGFTRATLRNTGWLSTDGINYSGRLEWLRTHYREQYIQLIDAFPHLHSK